MKKALIIGLVLLFSAAHGKDTYFSSPPEAWDHLKKANRDSNVKVYGRFRVKFSKDLEEDGSMLVFSHSSKIKISLGVGKKLLSKTRNLKKGKKYRIVAWLYLAGDRQGKTLHGELVEIK